MAALRSKIARLPYRLREEVNSMLHDGAEGQAVLDWLNERPEVIDTINAQNLTNWRQSGYQDWLAQLQRVDGTRALGDLAVRLAEAGGGNLAAGASAVVAGHILEQLQDIKTLDICDPESIPVIKGITDAITKITRNDIQIRRTQIAEQSVELAKSRLDFDMAKFQRDTAARIRELALSGEVQAVVGANTSKDEQIEQLIQLAFGDLANIPDRRHEQAVD